MTWNDELQVLHSVSGIKWLEEEKSFQERLEREDDDLLFFFSSYSTSSSSSFSIVGYFRVWNLAYRREEIFLQSLSLSLSLSLFLDGVPKTE
jgi:hypothetical protein